MPYPYVAPGPHIDRVLRLNFQGDWGSANFHRVCSWLSQGIIDRTAPDSKVAIWSGRGGADAARAVADGLVDMAVTTPAGFSAMAVKGIGPFAGQDFSSLRALGTLPQVDRLVFAIRRDLEVASFDELLSRRPGLTIATSTDDSTNLIGFCGRRMLDFEGLTQEVVESWGGRFIDAERPDTCLEWLIAGEAQAVAQEAIMTPWWREAAEKIDLRFLSFSKEALAKAAQSYGWQSAPLKAGYLRGVDADVAAVDFSDFLLLVRDDMPDDVAHLITWCLVETRNDLERQYHHVPADRSPLTYPLEPAKMAQTSVPLHPGAEHYYRSAQHL